MKQAFETILKASETGNKSSLTVISGTANSHKTTIIKQMRDMVVDAGAKTVTYHPENHNGIKFSHILGESIVAKEKFGVSFLFIDDFTTVINDVAESYADVLKVLGAFAKANNFHIVIATQLTQHAQPAICEFPGL